LTMRTELRWRRARRRAAARRAGVARSLAGPRSFRALRATPPESVALSATVGKRVPPLTLLLRAPRAETLRSAPNAVRRPPRQGRPPRSTLRAPSIVRVERTLGLRRIRSRCRSRGFAASIRPPTLFHRALPKKRWLDGRYRGLITRGRSRRASLDDFCNPCDPQARFPRDRWIPCFPCPRPKSRAGEEQVRAPCGVSQPRPFGRGSAVAGS
jgi:hypothetical protein